MKQIVLMYHDVYRDSPTESGFQNPTAIKYKVRASELECHVKAVDEYLCEKKLPASSVDFTFDDGGVSFLTVAAPILEKYGFRGKFYVSTGFIGSEGFLNAEQIRELHERGHIVGSHSHLHPERISSMTDDEINDEWRISQMKLQEVLGFTPKYASIPNGYSSKTVLNAMIAAGITVIDTSATTTSQKHYDGAVVRGRYAITGGMTDDGIMSLMSSPFVRLKKALRWHCLSIAKSVLGDTYLSIRAKLTK